MNKTVLVLGAGGPAATNVIDCFHIAGGFHVIGADADPVMLKLSHADENYTISHASNTDEYFRDVNRIVEEHDVGLVYPQSDREVYVCANHKDKIPHTCLPKIETVATCRDKGLFYKHLANHNLRCNSFRLYGDSYGFYETAVHGEVHDPFWVRARYGAGGYMAYQCDNDVDFRCLMAYYNMHHSDLTWMKEEYLPGRNYCWTSIWKDGKLLTSVLKERVRWVYGRIGTCAAQKTVANQDINELCEAALKALNPELSGLMMVDLKEDVKGTAFITEVNAGRLGTVNRWFAEASQRVYGDNRVNFPFLLWSIHSRVNVSFTRKFDALPEDVWCLRHIDMGEKLLYPVEVAQ